MRGLGSNQTDLSQPDEEVKDVGVVVDHSARLHVGGELSLALGVQRLVEIVLTFVKPVLAQRDGPAQAVRGREQEEVCWCTAACNTLLIGVMVLHKQSGAVRKKKYAGAQLPVT